MKKPALLAIVAATLILSVVSARGEELITPTQDCKICDPGCCGGNFFANVDFLFTKFYQSGGARLGGDEPSQADAVSFNLDLAPRLQFGYVFSGGLGVRATYWDYDDTAATVSGADSLTIKATTVDIELFQNRNLGSNSQLQYFGGLRWSEFNQQDTTGLNYAFHGLGATIGAQVSRRIGRYGSLYGLGRTGFVMGDAQLFNDGSLDDNTQVFFDHVSMQSEVQVGWQSTRPVGSFQLTYGVAADLMHWTDALIGGDDSEEANLYNAGWGGILFRVGLAH